MTTGTAVQRLQERQANDLTKIYRALAIGLVALTLLGVRGGFIQATDRRTIWIGIPPKEHRWQGLRRTHEPQHKPQPDGGRDGVEN